MKTTFLSLIGLALLAATLPMPAAEPVVFACDRGALNPEVRERHFDVLGPALRVAHKRARELPNGYEFEFSSDPKTVQLVSDWTAGERLCCPFFDIDLHFEPGKGPLWLRLSGGPGVKDFITSEFASWFTQRREK